MDELDDVVKEFLVESHENLDQLERDLVELEEAPDSREALARIFRTVHTIKGTCGFLGFLQLEKVAHVGENLLSRLRDGKLTLNADRTSALLSLVDAIRNMLREIEASGAEGGSDHSDLVTLLTHLLEPDAKLASLAPGDPAGAAGAASPADEPALAQVVAGDEAPASLEAALASDPSHVSGADACEAPAENATASQAPANFAVGRRAEVRPMPDPDDGAEAPEPLAGKPGAAPMAQQDYQSVAAAPPSSRSSALGSTPSMLAAAAGDAAVAVAPAAQAPNPARREPPEKQALNSVADTTIRVDVAQLDKLMNLVGELVLARNQILQFTTTQSDAAFVATTQRLNLVTTELQEGVMKTRMQPIDTVWGKFPRVVRDVARQCGKLVRIEMEGRDTELDKTIIEAIKDPLTHIVRNAVDHGLEKPTARQQLGKRAEGKLSLHAYHEGGHVNIEIADDGQGIDATRIRDKALARGLITEARAAQMGEREILNLIFAPGFSTAESVTAVSGRGVGMDVVKTNIERIGGTVDITSTPGRGTSFRIKIPLTLAIIPALVVSCQQDSYAIPQVSLVELVRLEGDRGDAGVEYVQGVPIYRLRGNLLPILDLGHELYGRPSQLSLDRDDVINIVVLQADERQFGLVVDDIQDTEEIVVKPLSKQLKSVGAYAGATIMGDGRVALILDVLGLAQRARVVSETRDRSYRDADVQVVGEAGQRDTLLLVRYGNDRTMAIPLGLVSRLEEVRRDAIEQAGPSDVVQYRGQIMPLLDLARVIPGSGTSRRANGETVPVVVFNNHGQSVGVIVDYIHDIVEDVLDQHRGAKRSGVKGAAVIQGKVVELLDVAGVIGMAS